MNKQIKLLSKSLKYIIAFVGCFIILGIIFLLACLLLSLFPGQLQESFDDIYPRTIQIRH